MKIFSKSVLALAFVLAMSAAVAQDDVQAAIEDLATRYQDAYNAGNFEEVANLHTEDGWLSDATGQMAQGREQIAQVLSQPPDPALEGTTLEIMADETTPISEGAVTRGSYAFRGQDGTAMSEGNWMAWQEMVDGEWQIRWLIINMIPPEMPEGEEVGGGGAADDAEAPESAVEEPAAPGSGGDEPDGEGDPDQDGNDGM